MEIQSVVGLLHAKKTLLSADGFPFEQRSKFHMYWLHLPLTRIHTRRKLFAEVRKVSVRFNVSHA